MNTLVDVYADDDPTTSSRGEHLSTLLDAYASLQHDIQRMPNPSGTFDDLSGLGEPKFTVDGSAYTGSWGRPQRDGPALRALTLMHYLRAYNTSHPLLWGSAAASNFFSPLYMAAMPPHSLIKADLEYVSHFWNESSFDLWEEVDGLHFFTLITSARSLREGAKLATAFGDDGAADWYAEQAGYIEKLLPRFWNTRKGHLVATLWSKRSGLDCGLLLGSLHALPAPQSGDTHLFPPWSDEILVSLLALARDQAHRFPINRRKARYQDGSDSAWTFSGTGIGRYPEDGYDGYATTEHAGNPWFLCTCSAAEVLFRTADHVSSSAQISISQISLPFFQALLPTQPYSPHLSPGSYTPDDPLFHDIVTRLHVVGDQFLDVVRAHVDDRGRMSEQFDRETGFMRGAEHLTWSYGAFLQAVRARKGARGL